MVFYVDLSRAIWRSSGTPQHRMASKMGLTCCYWCFHVLSNTSIWWDWEKKFPSKWMRWFSLQVLCRFWIFLCIFIFLPPNFNVSYSLINVWPLTRTYTFVNHVWWVGISSFKFNCLTFLVIHLIWISYLLSVKTSDFFKKCFENSSFFWRYGISTNTTFLETSKKPGKSDVLVSFLWFFLKWHYW